MAETRGDPRTEGRAAFRNAGRALFYAALGVAVVLAVAQWWPADLEPSTERTAENVVLGVLALVAVGVVWFGLAALVRAARWRRARRWERMLADPATAALVPPTEAHVSAVPEQPGGVKVVAKLLGLSLLVIALVTYGVLALLDVVPLPKSDAGNEDPFPVFVGVVLAVGGVVAAWQALRKWRIGRAVERLGLDLAVPGAKLHGADISPRRANVIPPLDVTILKSLPSGATSRRITAEANSFGDPPPSILYLRLFDNEQGTQRFLSGAWREYGYVHLLRSATSVTEDELNAAQRTPSGESLFITSEAELEAALADAPRGPVRRPEAPDVSTRLRGLIARRLGGEVDDNNPVYPARQLLCHDAFWKRAIDVLLARVDLVVLDLAGYHREHVGTGYELQRVVDRVQIERVGMLGSAASDQRFLEAQVRAAWSQMAAGSPNAGTTRRSVLIDCSPYGGDRTLLARVRAGNVHSAAAGGT